MPVTEADQAEVTGIGLGLPASASASSIYTVDRELIDDLDSSIDSSRSNDLLGKTRGLPLVDSLDMY